MNKLWIRLSLAFGLVVFIGIMVTTTTFAVFFDRPRFVADILTEDQLRSIERLMELQAREQFSESLLVVATIITAVGVVAGVWVSRNLTAPLNELAEAAQAIGTKSLRHRVTVRGSQEVMALAESFNQMAADLERAEQLRRNLVADVAHELRTPLTVLQGNLRAILDDVYPLNKEEVAHLYDQTRHLNRLINDLHELAQAEARQLALNLAETDIGRLVHETVASFTPLAEAEDIELTAQIVNDLPLVQTDSARIRQVLVNLLANAMRHTPENGRITVEAQPTPTGLQIVVQDSGEGIAPEHLPHVFDRFYRADPARSRDTGGAGLGLAIARAIVEAHGGRVEAKSEGVGKGSTFAICLPASAPG